MKISREVKIGFISILSIAILIWGFSFLKGLNIFKTSDQYIAVFNNVDGIIESSAVYLNGYRIGNVKDVDFNPKSPDNIVVKIAIQEKIKLPLKSHVRAISSNPIASAKDITIILYDTNVYYQPGDTILSILPEGLAESISSISSEVEITLDTLKITLQKLNNLFNDETTNNIKSTISNVSSISGSLNDKLAENGSLTLSMKNIQKITESIAKKNEEIKRMIQNITEFSDSLSQLEIKALVNNLTQTTGKLDSVMTKINDGQGSIGMLVNNDSLYYNLNSASQSLDLLLKDLKDHPKRYVHFSIFGKKDR